MCAFHRIKVVDSGCIVQLNVKNGHSILLQQASEPDKNAAVFWKAINLILGFSFLFSKWVRTGAMLSHACRPSMRWRNIIDLLLWNVFENERSKKIRRTKNCWCPSVFLFISALICVTLRQKRQLYICLSRCDELYCYREVVRHEQQK